MTERCDGCGREIRVAGGIANLWTFGSDSIGGLSMSFDADDSEHFLCMDCVERLPDDPTAEDVTAIEAHEEH